VDAARPSISIPPVCDASLGVLLLAALNGAVHRGNVVSAQKKAQRPRRPPSSFTVVILTHISVVGVAGWSRWRSSFRGAFLQGEADGVVEATTKKKKTQRCRPADVPAAFYRRICRQRRLVCGNATGTTLFRRRRERRDTAAGGWYASFPRFSYHPSRAPFLLRWVWNARRSCTHHTAKPSANILSVCHCKISLPLAF
jgi:hypothetical protein